MILTTLAAAATLGVIQQARVRPIDPFLNELSQKAFRFFVDQSHPKTGFTLDRAPNSREEPRKPDEYVSSVAAIGFALSAYTIGTERGWMPRAEAIATVRKTLRNLEEKPVRHRGWFYHWIHWETGERMWRSEVSTIDTAIFLAGMVHADQYFRDPEIRQRAKRIFEAIDWNYMLKDGGAKPDSTSFTMGYIHESGFIPARWDHTNELKVLLILALGASKEVPDTVWTGWERKPFKYKNWDLLVGGPLFLHQMSFVFMDFKNRRDKLGYDYWVSAYNSSLANRDYCIDNPGGFKGYSADIWGLSAADGPGGYRAYGAPVTLMDDDGTLAPSSTVATVMFIPDLAVRAAHAFKQKHPEQLGRYGFNISFNQTKNWKSDWVIGIDLGQMMLAIENHRDGFPHRLGMAHPIVKAGFKRAGLAVTKEAEPRKLFNPPAR